MSGREPAVSPCVYLLDALQSLRQPGFELLLRLAFLVFPDESMRMSPLARPSSPAFACAPTKAFIGSGRAIVNGLISATSLAETILTLVRVQNFVNIRHHVGRG